MARDDRTIQELARSNKPVGLDSRCGGARGVRMVHVTLIKLEYNNNDSSSEAKTLVSSRNRPSLIGNAT